mmetsp:Transcript_59264/g.168503  ORF Transcript_59264/g.168503 Transcript_59264/m.168503 type:complete len:134 (-) Transcript_59264:94-495(-)
MAHALLLALLASPALAALRSQAALGVPCPSTSLWWTDSEDAAGTTIWQGPVEAAEPDTCYPVGASGVKAYKICGPGTFTASRMTCKRHDYLPETVEHPKEQFTQGTCKVYHAAGTNVDGWIGSFSFGCPLTAR